MATLGDPHGELFLMDQEISCCLVNKTKSKAIIWKSQFFASQRTTDFPLKTKKTKNKKTEIDWSWLYFTKSHCYTENWFCRIVHVYLRSRVGETFNSLHYLYFSLKMKGEECQHFVTLIEVYASIKASNILEISHITTSFNRYSSWWLSKVITRWGVAALGDSLKKLAPVFQPKKSKIKTNRILYARLFPHFQQVTGFC